MKNSFLLISVLLAWLFVESLTPNAVASQPRSISDPDWLSMSGLYGANGLVLASLSDNSGNLYVAGSFTVVGNVYATNIAKWDGTKWSALGSGLNGQVRALSFDSNGDVVAGGDFTAAGANTVNHLAKWDGSSWTDFNGGVNGSVYALAFDDRNVYVGGTFTYPGVGTNLVCWNGFEWQPLGDGVDGPVYALAGYDGYLFAGGSFQYSSQGDYLNNLGRWDGTNWSSAGYGVNGTVSALTVAQNADELVVGGSFSEVRQSTGVFLPANNIVGYFDFDDDFFKMDNGSSLNGPVNCLFDFPDGMTTDDVIAGGEFTSANGTPANNIARCQFNDLTLAGTWYSLGAGMNSDVYTVCDAFHAGFSIYAGGAFSTAGGQAANDIAKWNIFTTNWSDNWSAVSAMGLNAGVSALVSVDYTNIGIYAAGDFTEADGNRVTHIARWNGTNWTAIAGAAVNGTISTLVPDGTFENFVFFAGGDFTVAGGNANIDYFDERSGWSPLDPYGPGVNGPVSAIAPSQVSFDNYDVYVGGSFTKADSLTVSNIAGFDPDSSSWFELGGGVNGQVMCLTLVEGLYPNPPSSLLYAGGDFTTAGTNVVNDIAEWDGTNWLTLGSGFNNTVYALTSLGSTVYAGGSFNASGTNPVSRVAKWDGTNWVALGAGLNSDVNALAVWGNDLYAGGNFTRSGTNVMNYIAKWDGTNWSSLGSGTDGFVSSLLVGPDGYFYAGGEFTTAGRKLSPNIARAIIADPGRFISISKDYFGPNADGLVFSGTPGVDYTLESTPTLSPPHWQKNSNVNISSPATGDFGLGIGVGTYEGNDSSTNGMIFYRSVWPTY